MLSKLLSGAVVGLEALLVTVEVDIAAQGLPNFFLVGLADKSIDESKERVRSAIKNSGAEFPAKRITVNLAPADLHKVGPAYDLPIALGILFSSEQLPFPPPKALFLGELSLDGTLRHTTGVLSLVLLAKEQGISEVFLPAIDAREGAVIEGVNLYPVTSLIDVFNHLTNQKRIQPQEKIVFDQSGFNQRFDADMADVVGQEQSKRALEIAMAGGHNIFLRGLPGAGKTMLARISPTILPPLTESEAIEVTKIYSITGNLAPGTSLMVERPFRSPHHTTSQIGLIGGGKNPLPGEISLAHRGVLFLDEFPEFPRYVLEALRQPLEDGIVTISRAAGTVTYPARFLLIAAANPCPCGHFGSDQKQCVCSTAAINKYRQRISGPILDRIDLHVSVPSVSTEKLTALKTTESSSSSTVRARVIQARTLQYLRFSEKKIHTNSEMTTKMVKEFCSISSENIYFMKEAVSKFSLSARSYYRVLKVARTIADLTGSETIEFEHLAEALMYRPKEGE